MELFVNATVVTNVVILYFKVDKLCDDQGATSRRRWRPAGCLKLLVNQGIYYSQKIDVLLKYAPCVLLT